MGCNRMETKYSHLIEQSGGDPNQFPKAHKKWFITLQNKIRVPVNIKNTKME